MKKPIYKTRERIIARIDSTLIRVATLKIKADRMDSEAKSSLRKAATALTPEVTGHHLAEARNFRAAEQRAVKCIERANVKLGKLKRSLAAFDTDVFTFMEGDKKVVEQSL